MSGATHEGFLFFLEPTGEDQTEAGKTSTAATSSSSHRLERRRKASELALRAIAGRDTADRRRGAVDWRERWCSLRGDVLHVYDDRLSSLATPSEPAPRQVLLSDYQHLQTTGSFDPRNQGVWELALSRQSPTMASARTLPRSTTSGSISSFFDRLGSSSSNLSGLATAKTSTEETTRWHKLTHRPRRLYQLMSSSSSSSNNTIINNNGSNTGTRSRTVSSSSNSSTMTIGSSAQDHGQAAATATKDADAAPLVLRVSDAQAMVRWSEAIAAVLRDAQSAESPSDVAVALGPRHRQRPSLSVFVDERPPRDDDPVLTAGAASRKRRGDPIASGLVRQSAASPPPSSSSPLPPPSSFQMTSKAKSSVVVVSDIMTKSRSKSRSRSRPVTAQGLLDQHRLSTASTASPPASTRRASLSSTLSRPSTASGRLSTEDSARKRDSLRSIRSSSSASPRVLLSFFGPVSSEPGQGEDRLTPCAAEEPLHGRPTAGPSEGLGLDLGPRPSPISAYDQFCTSHFSSPPDAMVVAAGDEDREEEEILHSPASTTAPAAMPRSQSLLNLAQRASKATRSVLSPSAAAYNLRKSVSFQKPAVLARQDNEDGRTPACSSVDSFELVHASPSLPAISLADSPSSIGSHGSSVVLASLSPAPRTPSPSFAIISSSSSSRSTNAGPATGNAGKKMHWTLPSSSTSKRVRLTATAKKLASPRSSPLSFSSTTLSSSSADGHDTGAGAGAGAGAEVDAGAGAGATARNNSLPTNGIHCGSSTATFSSSSVSSCSSPPSTPVVAEMPRAAAPLPMLVQRILPPEEIISTLDRIRKLELEEAASVDDDDAAAAAAADGGSLAIAGNAGRSTPVLDHHHHLRALSTSISLAEVCEQKRKPDGLHPQYNRHQHHHHQQHRPGSAQRPRTMRPATSADHLSLSPAPRAKRQQSRLFRVHSDSDGDGDAPDDGRCNDAMAVHVDLRSGAAMSTGSLSQQLPSTPRSSNKRVGGGAEGTARSRRETTKGSSAGANADENAGDQHETPGRSGSTRSAMGDRTNASLPMSWSTSTVTPKQQRQRTRSISGAFSTP